MKCAFMYGEIVDVNLVRDKGTEKSKGFAFVAYEDQRNNLNGTQVLGHTIRVDHVGKQRAANTSWGAQDAKNEKRNDRIEGPTRGPSPSNRVPDTRMHDKDSQSSRIKKDGDRKEQKCIQVTEDQNWTKEMRIYMGMGGNYLGMILGRLIKKMMIKGRRKGPSMNQNHIEETIKNLIEGAVMKNRMEEKIKNLIEGLAIVENRHPVTTSRRIMTSVSDHTKNGPVIKRIPFRLV
nr:hypothetical protein [Tanacetum cinerariifolium]